MAKNRNYSTKDVSSWKFDEPGLPEPWASHLGELPIPFSIYIEGDGGAGKTEYEIMMSKMMANHIGKIFINNTEQGKHKSITQSAIRNEVHGNVPPGKWMYNSLLDFEEYKARLRKRNSCKIAFIDSISFWELKYDQVKSLFEEFPRKSLVVVAYLADATKNKSIKHLFDIKVLVKDFIAYPQSRFGGNEPFLISEEMHRKMMRKKGKAPLQKGLFD